LIFTVERWEDRDNIRHDGPPYDITDTYGVFVHVTDPKDESVHHYFWAWVGGPFETWDQWYVYIGALMAGHGMELE
jgi:hypothetical protein